MNGGGGGGGFGKFSIVCQAKLEPAAVRAQTFRNSASVYSYVQVLDTHSEKITRTLKYLLAVCKCGLPFASAACLNPFMSSELFYPYQIV